MSVLCFAQRLDGLELYDDLTLDENVDPVRADAMAIVIDDEFPFDFCGQVFVAKLDQQSSVVDVFQKSRTQRLMHTNDASDDAPHECIRIHTPTIISPPRHPNSPPGPQDLTRGIPTIANIPNISKGLIH